MDQKTLQAALIYNPGIGYFMRRIASGRHGCHKAAEMVGHTRENRYVVINLHGRNYGAHRLAWLYIHGEWPLIIDHINGNPSDNRIKNLRNVTQSVNMQNIRKAPANSFSGILGASKNGRCTTWSARIRVDGKVISLGRFPSPEEAHQAYVAAKRIHHPGGML